MSPIPDHGQTINACLVGTTIDGVVLAFRGTLPLVSPDTEQTIRDWINDLDAELVRGDGLPGLVHAGYWGSLDSRSPARSECRTTGIGRYSMALFSLLLGADLLLSTLAPILLVLVGPIMLALRALAPAAAGNPPEGREWLVAFTRSWVVRMATHPVMALGMYLASFWVMYPTGLFDAIAASHWAHLVMNTHALLMGYPY